jgi:D-alanyl-D-alanine carboxypeptidase
MRRTFGPLVFVLLVAVGVTAGRGTVPTFRSSISELSAAQRARMTGTSWRRGCPVALRDLRTLTVSYWGFDGRAYTGRLIVNETAARPLRFVFKTLYGARFPIRRMRPIDAYGGSDYRSIEADNTSAFNCRRATGSSSWSQHAYGLAVDVDPIENPYVESGRVYHDASRSYVRRTPVRPGMAVTGGTLVEAFRAVGWGWGGDWAGSVKDYQHFSSSGR